MKEENFKKQIISKVEIFLKEITQKPTDVNSKTIFSSLNDLEYFFEILTNYIQDERLNLNLEGMEITSQSKKRLDNAERLFKFTRNEFSDIKKIISENTNLDQSQLNLIKNKFESYIYPKLLWIFDDEDSIELTALKHLYDLGEID
ncbi:MAG: hypothetical protein FI682_04060 [SAR202 cluster bacterium]|nr:hypothetical protein [SAR202 cluster bacterium]OUU73640.1 MAG: hypothetical protein CBC30_06265 [Chloroflexi bacterium TMED70]|tara:strand:- start:2413 stop:2850 length:438 start_codon:yes stop_codon:yes gene_type:complete